MNRFHFKHSDHTGDHRAYLITALVILTVTTVLLNIAAVVFSGEFNLTADITSKKMLSLSAENKEFIRSYKNKAEILVLADRDDYLGEGYKQYVKHNMQTEELNNDLEPCLVQTVKLLEEYPKLNKNITLKFTDPYGDNMAKLSKRFSDAEYGYGDIIVSVTDKNDSTSYSTIKLGNMYDINTEDGYEITANRIETALASKLTMSSVAMFTDYCDENTTYVLSTILSDKYTFTEISGEIAKADFSDCSACLISSLEKDISEEDAEKLDEFLNKGGKKLLYFAAASTPDTPNLNKLLSNWGVEVGEGVLAETNEENRMPSDVTTFGLQTEKDNNYIQSSDLLIISGQNAPVKILESKSGVKPEIVLKSSDTAVLLAEGADGSSTDGGTEAPETAVAAVSEAVKNGSKSRVFVGCADMLNINWINNQYSGNYTAIGEVVDSVIGGSGLSVKDKAVPTEKLTVDSEEQKIIISVFFAALLPILMLIVGITVVYKNKAAAAAAARAEAEETEETTEAEETSEAEETTGDELPPEETPDDENTDDESQNADEPETESDNADLPPLPPENTEPEQTENLEADGNPDTQPPSEEQDN